MNDALTIDQAAYLREQAANARKDIDEMPGDLIFLIHRHADIFDSIASGIEETLAEMDALREMLGKVSRELHACNDEICEACGGSGFSGQGTGYGDVCGHCIAGHIPRSGESAILNWMRTANQKGEAENINLRNCCNKMADDLARRRGTNVPMELKRAGYLA